MTEQDKDNWVLNYFNYFTEIEEHFQRARGTALFLLSPLDWALIASWQNAGVPLEAVLRGIDAAFEKWRARRSRTRMVNSLAFCAQAVMEEAEAIARGGPRVAAHSAAPPFPADDLRAYLTANAQALRQAGLVETAAALDKLAEECQSHMQNLEELEQRLTAMEEKVLAKLKTEQSDEDLFQARRQLDAQLRPYRGKMSAEQIALLERQYLDRWLLERAGLPRLSLFYLR